MSTTKPKWLNSTVLGIGAASLFSDVAHEMATAAMPALLATLGGSSAILGLIEGLADGLSSFAKFYSGRRADSLKSRKPLAVVGYLVTACGMASFGLATRPWHILLGRVGGWLGRGARTPVRNLLLTEATTPETYGKAFGLERAMDSVGAILGPLLALVLLSEIGLRRLFALTLFPGILAALSIAFLVKERPRDDRTQPFKTSKSLLALPERFKTFLVGVGIAGLGDFSKTLLILWATQAWTSRYGPAQAAGIAMFFYIGYNAVYAVSCYASGSLADRLDKSKVLAVGYALAVIPAIALACPGASFLKFAIVFGGSGLYMGIWETVESTTAAAILPAQIRGRGFGTLASINGLGDLVSSALVGGLWVLSPCSAMAFVGASSLLGALLILKAGHVPSAPAETRAPNP